MSKPSGCEPPHPYLSVPYEVHFKVTNRCNLRCRHCHSSAGRGTVGELPSSSIRALCRDLRRWDVSQLAISGGEPLVREDCLEIIKYAVNLGLRVKLNTNGTLLCSDTLRSLWSSGVRSLMVSLDAADPAIHDAIRGAKGAWRSTTSAVAAAVSMSFAVMLRMTVSEANRGQVVPLVRMAAEIGATAVGITPVLALGRAANRGSEYGVGIEEWSEIARCARGALKGKACRLEDTFSFFRFPASSRKPTGLAAYLTGCKAGKSLISVSSDGTIWPCSLLHGAGMRVGHIHQNGLRDAWFSSPVLAGLRGITPGALGSPCDTCRSVWQCMGGCRAYAMVRYGSARSPDPRCPKTRGVSGFGRG